MRKIGLVKIALVLAGAFLLAAFFPQSARAQFTTVSGTVTDPNGIPYGNGTMSAVLVPGSPGGWTLSGNPYSGRVGPITLDSTGSFIANFGSNALILPAGTTWQITVNSNQGGIAPPLGTGAQTFSINATISGASQSITAALDAAAPKLTNISIGVGSVTSVSCGNLANVFTCSVTNPTTTPALVFSPISTGPSLDCSTFPGADMGAKLNACLAALPAAGGIADATKFTSPQTISTPVVNSYPATIYSCGIVISEVAKVLLSGTGSTWYGCPNQITIFNKAGNIDQFELSGTNNSVQFVTLNGSRSSPFTGNGVTVDNGVLNPIVSNDTIHSEASALINDAGSLYPTYDNLILSDEGVNAIVETGTFQSQSKNVNIQGPGTETGPMILLGSNSYSAWVQLYTDTASATQPVISATSVQKLEITDSSLQQLGGAPAFIASVGLATTLNHDLIFGGGTAGAAVSCSGGGNLTITNSTISNMNPSDVVLYAGCNGNVADNTINMVAESTGKAGVHFSTGNIGSNVHHNQIYFASGEAPSGDNYGVWLQQPAATDFEQITVDDNLISGTTNAHDRGVYYDNHLGAATGGQHIIRNNKCSDTGTSCIERFDTHNLIDSYIDNQTNTAPLFDGGGGTNDIVVQHQADGITSGTLPVAGGGSQIADTSLITHFYNTLATGLDNSIAGGFQAANGAANAHTIFGSAATTSNTILGPAVVIPNGHLIECSTSGVICTLVDGGTPGTGTVSSVSFTGGLISVATPTTTPAFTVAGTSGGIPYFSAAATWASSGVLASGGVVLGGGAGTTPATNTQLTFAGSTLTVGLAGTGSGILRFGGSASGNATITAPATAGTSTNPFTISNSLQLPSGTVYQFNGDTGISRDSAGVLDIGTGAAGSTAGSIQLLSMTSFQLKGGNSGTVLYGNGTPSIASGFGSGASIPNNNQTAAFTVNVGTGGAASTGVITMPTAAHGWACFVAPNGAPQAAAVTYSTPTSTTSITLTNYTLTTGIALAWTASLVFQLSCWGY